MGKRYALFSGYNHQAMGGWDDLDTIGSLDECKAQIDLTDEGRPHWAHIVDLDAGKEVLCLLRTGWFDSDPYPTTG